MSDTFIVVATPRERWSLAVMLVTSDVKFKEAERVSQMRSLRKALALKAPIDAYLVASGESVGASANDNRTRNRFEVTRSQAAALEKALEQIARSNVQDHLFGDLVEQILARATTAPDAETAPACDPGAEDWEKPLPPVLEPPMRFALWFKRVCEVGQSWGRAREIFIQGLTTPEQRQAEQAARDAGLVNEAGETEVSEVS